jgi:hypothetical protein
VREFRCDVAAANDEQSLREHLDPHDRVGGMHRSLSDIVLVQPGDVRDDRPAARGDDEPVRSDLGGAAVVQPDGHRLAAGEPPGAREDRGVGPRRALPERSPAGLDLVHPGEDAIPHRGPVHGLDPAVDAEFAAAPGALGQVGRVDVHLGRDAAHVQAGAAERPPFDDGDVPVIELAPGDGVTRAGPDDDQVEMTHAPRLI